jgi:hypothetical protein
MIKRFLLLFLLLANFFSVCVAETSYFDSNKLQFKLGGGWEQNSDHWRVDTTPYLDHSIPGPPTNCNRALFPGHIYVSGDVMIGGELIGDYPISSLAASYTKTKDLYVSYSIVSTGNAQLGGWAMGNVGLGPNWTAMGHFEAFNQSNYAIKQGFNRSNNEADSILVYGETVLNAGHTGVANGRLGFRSDNTDLLVVKSTGIGINLGQLVDPLTSNALEVNGDVEIAGSMVNLESANMGIQNKLINGEQALTLFSKDGFIFSSADTGSKAGNINSSGSTTYHRFFGKIGIGARSETNFKTDTSVEIQIDGSISLGLRDDNVSASVLEGKKLFFNGLINNTDDLYMCRFALNPLAGLRTVIGDDSGLGDPEPYVYAAPGTEPDLGDCSKCSGPSGTYCDMKDDDYLDHCWGRYHYYSRLRSQYNTDHSSWVSHSSVYEDSKDRYNIWFNTKGTRNEIRDAVAIGYINEENVWSPGIHIMSDSGEILSPSDVRLKKKIKNLTDSNKKVSQLRPVTFLWKNNKRNDENNNFGLIAQEVEPILPNLVSTKNKYKMISYEDFLPVILEAMKEQASEIETLQNNISNLKNELIGLLK